MVYKFNIYELQALYSSVDCSILNTISQHLWLFLYVRIYIALGALEQPWRTTGLSYYYKELHDKCNYLWQNI